MTAKNKTRPRLAERKPGKGKTSIKSHSSTTPSGVKSPFDNLNLIAPAEYYRQAFPGIFTNREWVTVLCPFHDDTRPSLSINVKEGCYKCHACDAKGGSIIKFHKEKCGLTWKQAIAELVS